MRAKRNNSQDAPSPRIAWRGGCAASGESVQPRTSKEGELMETRFKALELSLIAIRSLRPVVKKMLTYGSSEADQIRRSAASVTRNLGEGRKRTGKDRRHHFRIASGSADEVIACLRIGEAWGYLREDDVKVPLEHYDRLSGMLWSLTR